MQLARSVNAIASCALVLLASCASTHAGSPAGAGGSGTLDGGAQADSGALQDSGAQDARPTCRFPFPEVATLQIGPDALDGWETRCGIGCTPGQATQLDTAGCARSALLCFHSDTGGGGLRPDCHKNVADGRIVFVSDWVLSDRPGWVRCDANDRQEFEAGDEPPCVRE